MGKIDFWFNGDCENDVKSHQKGILFFARVRKPLSHLRLPYDFKIRGVKPIKSFIQT